MSRPLSSSDIDAKVFAGEYYMIQSSLTVNVINIEVYTAIDINADKYFNANFIVGEYCRCQGLCR